MPLSPTIAYGNYPIKHSQRLVRTGPGQFDTGSAVYFYTESQPLNFFVGSRFPDAPSLYIDQLEEQICDDRMWRANLSLIGVISGGEKRLRRVSAFGQEVSIGPVTYESSQLVGIDTNGDGRADETARELVEALRSISTPSGIGTRWIIDEPVLAVSDTYFMSSPPDTSQIGRALTPPNAPPPPQYIWGGYQDALRFHHPNGWVLESRDYENPYPGLYRVNDTFAYKQQARPD